MADQYGRPDMLVETDWLAAHLDDPKLRVVDADYPLAYGRARLAPLRPNRGDRVARPAYQAAA